MQNQNGSPPMPESSGPISPISEAWEEVVENSQLHPDSLGPLKSAYFAGAMASYNYIIGSLRVDPTLALTVKVTDAIKRDIDDFYKNFGPQASKPH